MSEVRLRGSACRPLPHSERRQRTIVIGIVEHGVGPACSGIGPTAQPLMKSGGTLALSVHLRLGRRISGQFHIEHGAVELAARDLLRASSVKPDRSDEPW